MHALRRLAVPALALLVARAVPASAQTISNPDLFGKSLAAAQEALDEYGEYDNDQAQRRVADIGYRLAASSGFTKFPLQFFLVEMREPNAFALPGGQVFVTRGMLDLGLDDDELAALLGHEIAHVVLEHGTKMQRRATLLNVLSSAVLVGVILAESRGGGDNPPPGVPYYGRTPGGVSTSGDRIQGAAAASMILGELLLRSYSREYEDQADEEGQRMAAAAGFDPRGTVRLFSLMRERLPQSKEYGYWRTHPFFDERVTSAQAREALLKVQEPKPDDGFRAATQAVLLEYEPKKAGAHEERETRPDRRSPGGRTPEGADAPPEHPHHSLELMLENAALTAWPRGETAERLRLQQLHRLRDEALEGAELSRDYGKVLRAYQHQREQVAAITPESPFLARLDAESAQLRQALAKLYPQAVAVVSSGVYQTPFLERFLSNFPDAPEVPTVAIDLADAYARLGRPTDAVDRYLQAWHAAPDGPVRAQALAGMRRMAVSVDRLSALEQLSEIEDQALRASTEQRLAELATTYSELDNGAEYLRRFPDGPHAGAVEQRLDQLAEQLYGEVILYQGIGDTVKALERIQKILTQAPLSPAADRLRERAVLEG